MSGILKLVLSLSLGGSLLALLVLGMRLLLGRRLPSIFYYYAWLLVLLRLVLPLPGFLGPGRESVEPPAPARPNGSIQSRPLSKRQRQDSQVRGAAYGLRRHG